MGSRYYAVKKGKTPGIYETWDECKAMVDGFPNAEFKKFSTLEEAKIFMGENRDESANAYGINDQIRAGSGIMFESEALPASYAFVDGSFNENTGVYGYGGFLVNNGEKIILQGSGSEKDMVSMRNIAGEISGSTAAVKKALELGISELTIYYDYMGIEMWATGGWKRNKSGTIAYHDFIQSVNSKIRLNFVHVKGHSGIEGNEEADRLAKKAVGIG